MAENIASQLFWFTFTVFVPVVLAVGIYKVAKSSTLDYRYRREARQKRLRVISTACFYCLAVVTGAAAVITLLADMAQDEEHADLHWTKAHLLMFGAKTFTFLLLPSGYGVFKGFKAEPKPMPSPSRVDDY